MLQSMSEKFLHECMKCWHGTLPRVNLFQQQHQFELAITLSGLISVGLQ